MTASVKVLAKYSVSFRPPGRSLHSVDEDVIKWQ